MTQKEMVAALDQILERWQRARAILAELEPELHYEPANVAVPAEVSRPIIQHRRKRTQVKQPIKAETPPLPAIQSKAPTGPVAVSAAEVARRRIAAAPLAAPASIVVTNGSLESLVRELTERAS